MYRDDKLNGVKITYYKNGNIESSSNYVDNILTGEFKSFMRMGSFSQYASILMVKTER